MGNNRKLQFAIRAVLATATATSLVPAALSQTVAANTETTTSETSLQEVVVTGSRIAVAPNDISISPITTVSQLDIQQTGLIRTEDILNSLPSITAEQGSGQSISSTGTSTVSLRDLGSQRTLVLVNGVRMNPGGAILEPVRTCREQKYCAKRRGKRAKRKETPRQAIEIIGREIARFRGIVCFQGFDRPFISPFLR